MAGKPVVFGGYRLLRRVDDCDAGSAYVATRIGIEGFRKRVVLRRVGATAIRGVDFSAAVISEAKRAALLSHANIAHVLDLGMVDGMYFVATEYVTGHSLEALGGTAQELPWPIAVYLGCEVARALSYAHGRRSSSGELVMLIHRRLSPGRIMLSSAGDVKVVGFGTSWAWARGQEYRSPEETRGEPVDGRADVFALGVILRECLGQARVPKTLRGVIERAMHSYPEQRPTAAELQRKLTCILHTAERPVVPGDIAALAATVAPKNPSRPKRSFADSLLDTASQLETRGALFAAIERIELVLDSMTLEPSTNLGTMLRLYERLGRLCIRAHVGERGTARMARALDLADGLGRDEYAALFCTLHGELLAQANRSDESRDWLERAASFRS
ncbi:MAG: protein kinase [Myxococcales bacterium]|nr:MAG: protein kinase [Myxococcales bacterium]